LSNTIIDPTKKQRGHADAIMHKFIIFND